MKTTLFLTLLLAAILLGCHKDQTTSPSSPPDDTGVLPTETPQDLLLAAIQEVEALSDWSGPGRVTGASTTKVLLKADADTLYIYGEVTAEGYGATVTETHSYPKGIPLITVRKSHGEDGGRIVSEVRRYTSRQTFSRNEPAQSSITEVYALSQDTIVTYVRRNGVLETYTFRLPVVTVTIASTAENTRHVSRFARAGEILVETRDGNGRLLQTRRNTGLADGSLITRTEYPDGSWRSTRTLGRADGSILRENRSSTP